MGRIVDGRATMRELRIPWEMGKLEWLQARTKLAIIGVKLLKFHQPWMTSLKGRIEVMRSPKNGMIQIRPMAQARRWIRTVEVILRKLDLIGRTS